MPPGTARPAREDDLTDDDSVQATEEHGDDAPPADDASAPADPADSEETALLEAVGAPDDVAERSDEPEPDVTAEQAAVPADEPAAVEADVTAEHAAVADGDAPAPPVDEKAARRRAKAEAKLAARAEKDERRREQVGGRRARQDVPEPPSVPTRSGAARALSLVGVAIGVLGLAASVLLALAALLVAFGFEPDAGALRAVASVADPLTAPLRGLVTFSGENADAKESFVAYGGGSVVYLVVGVLAPSVLNRRS